MKKFTLSVAAVMAMSSFAIAGGDIAPVEPMVETPVMAEALDAGFYAGIAYGTVATVHDLTDGVDTLNMEMYHDTLMLQVGYQFNPYIAIEGRYWNAVGDTDLRIATSGGVFDLDRDFGLFATFNDNSNAWGIYLKPMYPITSELTAYGLVGYGNVDIGTSDRFNNLVQVDDSQFQWGLGASYDVNDNFAVFVDYVAMYDGKVSIEAVLNTFDRFNTTIDSWNFGVTYKF